MAPLFFISAVAGLFSLALAAPCDSGDCHRAVKLARQASTSFFNSTLTTAPTSTSTVRLPGTVSSTANACAIVSSSSVAQRIALPTVAAKLAYDCLNSVPLGKSEAIAFVDAIFPYLDWQSDLTYKASPPPSYFYPAFDVKAKLSTIKSNLENDFYSSEYTFQVDLFSIFAKSHDGHFVLYPDALTKAIEFGRSVPLVSLSSDAAGELPKIYLKSEVNSSTTSAVVKINGKNAAEFVAEWAYTASFNQDADAAYNSMFYEKAFLASGGAKGGYFASSGRMRYIYPGPSTTYEFANGTSVTIPNVGIVKGNFYNVVDGPSFYRAFCQIPVFDSNGVAVGTAESGSPASETAEEVNTIGDGYPAPVVATTEPHAGCYYLDGPGFENVAVLSLLSFEPSSQAAFQKVIQDCLAGAKAAGKTKIVVDLQANGGGYILSGYDAFRQFFPSIVQDGFSRFPLSDSFLTLAELISDSIPADYDPNTATSQVISNYEGFLNYRYDVNLTGDNFLTFEDKFAPHVYQNQSYSSLVRWNFSDPITTINGTYGFGIDITGYGARQNFTQPFAASDIVMLYDGFCASTCTVFSEGMRTQGGVKSVMFGGRPTTDPIQGVGGIKGAQSVSFTYVYQQAQEAKIYSTTAEQNATLSKFSLIPIMRSTSTGLNLRDQILKNNVDDGLPAQFVVEDADCRLFWTKAMVNDVREIWKAAAKAAWGGGKCIQGSLGTGSAEVSPPTALSKVQTKQWDGTTTRVAGEKGPSVQDMSGEWAARHMLKVIV